MLEEVSDELLEYPMVDKDPIARWTFGRVTFLGDAAHPMYQRGSNGAAQALIDARTLADLIKEKGSNPARFASLRRTSAGQVTAKIVAATRTNPPDVINIKVEELTGDKPFDNLDAFISRGRS